MKDGRNYPWRQRESQSPAPAEFASQPACLCVEKGDFHDHRRQSSSPWTGCSRTANRSPTGTRSSGITPSRRCANTNRLPGMSSGCAPRGSRSRPAAAACRRPFAPATAAASGPVIGAYAEYDAVPGNCQAATTRKMPREGLSKHAAGHTDPHSALGIGALGGLLAAKAAMEKHDIKGSAASSSASRRRSFACRSRYTPPRAITTASMPSSVSIPPTCCRCANTTRWDTHCGAAYLCIYSFECEAAGDLAFRRQGQRSTRLSFGGARTRRQ